MLGAFEDSELEPNEMQDVAFHLARCEKCTALLAEYGAIGRDLRSVVSLPRLGGFATAVMERIDNLPVPLTVRTRRFFDRINDRISSGLAVGAAVALAAMLTVVVATPYARRMLTREIPSQPLAKIQNENRPVELTAAGGGGPPMGNDSHAVISRLESQTSSVAVWSEPQTDTTVIWLRDEP